VHLHAITPPGLDSTKIIIITHLLGLAPAGYLTASDNGPEGLLWDGASQVSLSRLARCAIEPAESGMVRKPSGKKITTQV
jgi:hypothetical protein